MTTAGETFPVAGLALAVGLAVVHLFAGRLSADFEERSRGLSAAGGASVAYVFVLLLPEVSEAVLVFEQAGFRVEQAVYLVALLGFVSYFALEVYATRDRDEPVASSDLVFRVHVAGFAVYTFVIGYLLLHQERPGLPSLSFYALAMALHFLVTDEGLRRHHGAAYDDVGRWVLAAAIVAGAVVGVVTVIDELVVSMLFAFVAGGIILNVVKEELPEARQSSVAAFIVGAAVYAGLVLLV
ncbi:hypothetical protein ACFQH6_02160 [Halobacteriaceae archaeon GCM10025711]